MRLFSLGLNHKKYFLITIFLYILLGLYTLSVSFTSPFLGIELKELNGKWQIESFYDEEWADRNHLSIGDFVLSMNEIPVQDISYLQYDPAVRGAHTLSIQKHNGLILNINIRHSDVPQQFYKHFVFPFVYFLFSLIVAYYIYTRKNTVPNLTIIIAFLLTVSVAYISTGASSRMDSIGVILNSSFMILCLVVLIHFLKNYFTFLNIKWSFLNNIKILYVLPIVAIVVRIIGLLYPQFYSVNSVMILILFSILLAVILIVLVRSYIHYRLPQLKLLFIGLIVPFLPFLFLFVLPELLFKQPMLSADSSALFLLLIPFNIIFLQLTERLFDITYHITRFHYYVTMSFFFTCWLMIGVYSLSDLSITNIVKIAMFLFISIVIFLYIKEKIDYRERKILFSPKGQYIHKLYQVIGNLSKFYRIEEISQTLVNAVVHHLDVKEVDVIAYHLTTGQVNSRNDNPSIDITSFPQLSIGEIVKMQSAYIALVHQDMDCQRWIVIDHNRKIHLKAEELLWLELLLIYVHTFIESTKIIEELVNELQRMQQSDVHLQTPSWFKKLVWLRVDEEKFKFAQELHDSFLQEYIHIARQFDLLKHKKSLLTSQSELVSLHEQMIHSINHLRAYCESLKPPLFTNIGLHAALENLANRTMERANFNLTTTFERLYLEDEQLPLIIYRIVQELFNNAIKHSGSSNVTLSLQEVDNGFEMIYHDDGVGCNLEEIWNSESFGLQGIQERVEAFNGYIVIDSEPNKGMYIQITIHEGENIYDFSLDR